MKAIIVDDEYPARTVLKKLILKYGDGIEVIDECGDVLSAVESIKKNKPDVVFLDIEMPRQSGFEIFNYFNEVDFRVIFVTAYEKYAIKAFEMAALDYLLKPIEIDRLKLAIKRATTNLNLQEYQEQILSARSEMDVFAYFYTYLKQGYTYSVNYTDIIAFEAQGAYTKMYLTNGEFALISKNIKVISEEVCLSEAFKRVHRSWVVNDKKVVKVSKTLREIYLENDVVAKFSRSYKF